MKQAIGTICSGFGGVDVGALAAGLELAWGIEYDAKIAEVGNFNLGNHIKVADILNCDPKTFERVNVFHASLPCVRASVANSSAEVNEDGLRESALDVAMADKTIEFITTLLPDVVTLENVWAWRNFQSWRGGKKTKGIQQALFDAGYWLHVDHVNCADFGVPQTRKRMIARAVRGGFVPYLPAPEPWIGWYAAIEDLIPSLPDSQFAPWQLARLPAELQTMMVGGANTSEEQAAAGVGVSLGGEPTLCVNSSNSLGWRAFLAAQGCYGEQLVTVNESEPSFTITANSNQNGLKACLIDFANAGRDATKLDHELPSMAIQSWHGRRPSHYPAAFAAGRVVSMTPRCLARFQSFPDSYQLSGQKTLDAKGIGNACCPLLMEKVFRGLVNF